MIVGLICARGGSKGVPKKNTRELSGKPLIAWAIDHARAMARLDRIIVSTDSEEIASIARSCGAETPFLRPADLSRDDSPEWLVWRHALSWIKESAGGFPDALVVIPATAPLREVSDLDNCLDEYQRGECDIVITVTDSHRSPYFNMVTRRSDGTVGLVIPPATTVTRRQDAPTVYAMTTVAYVANPAFVMTRNGVFDGRVRSVHVPPERALDIDSELDLRLAGFLMTLRQK